MTTVRYGRLLAIAVTLAFLSAFASVAAAQDVRTDWDHNVQFENFHTYSWGKVHTTNPLWESRVQEAVDKELQAKGWQRVSSGGDVTIAAVGATSNQQEYQTFYDGLGGWGWGGFGDSMSTTTVQNVRIGSLVIDMYSSNNKHLIWRAVSNDTLSNNAEHNEKTLDKAVDKMFKKFPPEPKK